MKTMRLAAVTALLLATAPILAAASAFEDLAGGRELSEIPVPAAAAPADRSAASGIPATVRAFMDMIAYAEGTGDHYNMLFGGGFFEDYSRHPAIFNEEFDTDAAGRYQMLSTTWEEEAGQLGLTDFGPASQDLACEQLIKDRGAYDLVLYSDDYNNFADALRKLSPTWSSFKVKNRDTLWEVYLAALARHRARR